MKILYLTFYFEPDLCAGSFRNTPLVQELSKQLSFDDTIEVITTFPNRYNSYQVQAQAHEIKGNIIINRINIPPHKSDLIGQVKSFITFFFAAKKIASQKKYDFVYASSSRLFTAFLGSYLARSKNIPLYLDIRDIFRESILDVLNKKWVELFLSPILKIVEIYTFGKAKHINLVSEGFKSYFAKYHQSDFSYFTNGIDEEFIKSKTPNVSNDKLKTILYAGNIGEGQGLHTIIPQMAKRLEKKFCFKIIGDGGAKRKLNDILNEYNVKNIEILSPINRTDLIVEYEKADFLFLHLNDMKAFERVLPSKIFEYACFNKPIIAGVAGFAKEFVSKNVSNCILFYPGDVESCLAQIDSYEYKIEERNDFMNRFLRSNINDAMVKSIINFYKINVK